MIQESRYPLTSLSLQDALEAQVPEDGTFRIRDYLEGTDSKVPCPRCGALIVKNATICEQCGLHFRGRAIDFSPASKQSQTKDYRLFRHVTLILLVVLAIMGIVGLIGALVHG